MKYIIYAQRTLLITGVRVNTEVTFCHSAEGRIPCGRDFNFAEFHVVTVYLA
jgi:hypothetical protein